MYLKIDKFSGSGVAAETGKTILVFKVFLAAINQFGKPCLPPFQSFH